MTSKSIWSDILTFIFTYGESALRETIQHYIDNQQVYIHKTKYQTTKIKINDIYCLQSQQHNIAIHTSHGVYKNMDLSVRNWLPCIHMDSSCALFSWAKSEPYKIMISSLLMILFCMSADPMFQTFSVLLVEKTMPVIPISA